MDLFRELEKALRTYSKRLLIDKLLPAPEQIPSSLPDESTAHLPAAASGTLTDQDEEAGFGRGNLRETLEKMDLSDGDETADRTGRGNLKDEVKQFLAHQKSRGVHGAPDPKEPPPSPPSGKPESTGDTPPSDSES